MCSEYKREAARKMYEFEVTEEREKERAFDDDDFIDTGIRKKKGPRKLFASDDGR